MKKLIQILSIVIVMILGGCMMNNGELKDDLSNEEIKEKMLEYLEEKYEKSFACEYIEYQSWSLKGQEVMSAYPKDNPKDTFTVFRNHDEEGNITYEDGYIWCLMKPVYEEKINEIVNKYIPNNYMSLGSSVMITPNEMTGKVRYKDFKRFTDNEIALRIGVVTDMSKEEVQKVFELLCSEIQAQFLIGNVSVKGYDIESYEKIIRKRENIDEFNPVGDIPEQYKFHQNWGEVNQEYQWKMKE